MISARHNAHRVPGHMGAFSIFGFYMISEWWNKVRSMTPPFPMREQQTANDSWPLTFIFKITHNKTGSSTQP